MSAPTDTNRADEQQQPHPQRVGDASRRAGVAEKRSIPPPDVPPWPTAHGGRRAAQSDVPPPKHDFVLTQIDGIIKELSYQRTLIDNIEAYGRKDIVQLKKIRVESDRHGYENTTRVALGFLKCTLRVP